MMLSKAVDIWFGGGWMAVFLMFVGYWNLRYKASRMRVLLVFRTPGCRLFWGLVAFVVLPFVEVWERVRWVA